MFFEHAKNTKYFLALRIGRRTKVAYASKSDTGIVVLAACTGGFRRSQFMKGYIPRELKGVGIDATVYSLGVIPSPTWWLTRKHYNEADVVLSVSQNVDRAVAHAFGEKGHRRGVLDILDIYGRNGKLDEVSLRLLLAYESLKNGRDGVERLMARPEIVDRLNLGDVLEMRNWKGLVLRK